MGALAAIENVQPPTISRIVGTLEGEGWVARVADPDDKRVALVEMTDAGDQQLATLRADRDAWLARRLDALDPGDVRAILGAVDALERLFDESGGDASDGPDGAGRGARPSGGRGR
jgi:DNA-binding MarR family transcriptional regulator